MFAYTSESQGEYSKTYYENGMLQSEGWLLDGIKTGYWMFYHDNETIAEQCHFQNNQKEKILVFLRPSRITNQKRLYRTGKMMDWCLFYNDKGNINHKCQLREGLKNGYCLKYKAKN